MTDEPKKTTENIREDIIADALAWMDRHDAAFRKLAHDDPDFERQMEIAERIMHRDQDALKRLAKL